MITQREAVNKEKHVVVIESQDDDAGFSKNQWSNDVRKNLIDKLKQIPIEKSVHTKKGKGCIFVNDQDTMMKVSDALKDSYNVATSTKKKQTIQPKMKLFDLDTDIYNADSGDDLRNDILQKNVEINQLITSSDSSELNVLFIDINHNFAILKMTADVREIIMKKGFRIYLDLQSLRLRDHYHLLQCYTCQKFGHKYNSPHCSNDRVCLYCAKDHPSKECSVKLLKGQHACHNCLISSTYKGKDTCHTTTDLRCPFVIKETELLMKKTLGTTENDFLSFTKRHQKLV